MCLGRILPFSLIYDKLEELSRHKHSSLLVHTISVEEKNYTLIHQLVEADILVSRTVISMDIKLNRLINGKYRLPCFTL